MSAQLVRAGVEFLLDDLTPVPRLTPLHSGGKLRHGPVLEYIAQAWLVYFRTTVNMSSLGTKGATGRFDVSFSCVTYST